MFLYLEGGTISHWWRTAIQLVHLFQTSPHLIGPCTRQQPRYWLIRLLGTEHWQARAHSGWMEHSCWSICTTGTTCSTSLRSFRRCLPPWPCCRVRWRGTCRAGMQVPTYDKTWYPRVVFAARSTVQAGANAWQRTRLLRNQEKVIDWLNVTCQSNGLEFDTLRYYGDGRYTSVREQAHAVGRADILIGVHGAGLALQLFMPRDSLIFEIHVNSRTNHHFYNMANYLGHSYHTMGSGNLAEEEWVKKEQLNAVKIWR
eukprot:comp19701_c0_seq2/m.23429 comp19701_c0_seq2/g.23429  ORF comp19701_c0_seq2/g.23429 comp19701_c0_seq2/m.23429 type:complete len:257 (-) comp19701_c0_seq2:373-1143(-)